jgi:hypothetical protein
MHRDALLALGETARRSGGEDSLIVARGEFLIGPNTTAFPGCRRDGGRKGYTQILAGGRTVFLGHRL